MYQSSLVKFYRDLTIAVRRAFIEDAHAFKRGGNFIIS